MTASPPSSIVALIALFKPRRRVQFALVLILTLAGAVAELVSIGAVIPFLQIIAAPATLAGLPLARAAMAWLGIASPAALLVPAAILLIAAAIVSAVVRIVLVWATSRFVFGLTHDLSMIVYDRIIRQPYGLYVRRNSAEILSGMEKVHYIGTYLLNPMLTALSSSIIAAGIVLILLYIDPVVAVAAGGSVGLLYVGLGLGSRALLVRLGRRQAQYSTQRVKLVQESLGGIRDIILDRSHDAFSWQYRVVDADLRRVLATTNFIALAPRYVVEGIGIALIAVFALYFAQQPGGVLGAIPVLGALALSAQRLLPLAQNLNLAFVQYSSMTGMLQDVMDLIDAPVLPLAVLPGADAVVPFRDRVVLENIGFRYGPDGAALSDLSLVIRKGARIGIIGRTGSGKTTLLDVLMGLLTPTAGRMLIDGRPLDDDALINWQAQVAHVPQTIFLLDDSIAANIAFGVARAAIDMDRVRDAAARADVAEFVDRLPEGYETRVGERGVRLSGGQRQRLGIARALYKRATVLILDEATSALDDQTEDMVIGGIELLDRDLTILMIAHRLSTVAGCDEVIRLDKGRIVAHGSYAEVIGNAGASTQ